MSFEGFGPQALPFFKALAFHQTREWFEENRATYETAVKAPLGDLVEETAARLAKAKIPLKGDRKSSLFRIHRDVFEAPATNRVRPADFASSPRPGSERRRSSTILRLRFGFAAAAQMGLGGAEQFAVKRGRWPSNFPERGEVVRRGRRAYRDILERAFSGEAPAGARQFVRLHVDRCRRPAAMGRRPSTIDGVAPRAMTRSKPARRTWGQHRRRAPGAVRTRIGLDATCLSERSKRGETKNDDLSHSRCASPRRARPRPNLAIIRRR